MNNDHLISENEAKEIAAKILEFRKTLASESDTWVKRNKDNRKASFGVHDPIFPKSTPGVSCAGHYFPNGNMSTVKMIHYRVLNELYVIKALKSLMGVREC